jgi:hypothetical protein
MGEVKNVYIILARTHKGKRQLMRPRHRWKDNKTYFKENEGLDWIHVAQDRDHWQVLVNMVMNLQILKRWGIS